MQAHAHAEERRAPVNDLPDHPMEVEPLQAPHDVSGSADAGDDDSVCCEDGWNIRGDDRLHANVLDCLGHTADIAGVIVNDN